MSKFLRMHPVIYDNKSRFAYFWIINSFFLLLLVVLVHHVSLFIHFFFSLSLLFQPILIDSGVN